MLSLMIQSNSSNIREFDYSGSDDDGTLTVVFRNGRTYRYFGVPRGVYEDMMAVEMDGGSLGSFFNQTVRGAGYAYGEVK